VNLGLGKFCIATHCTNNPPEQRRTFSGANLGRGPPNNFAKTSLPISL
jgi:hypothetical protein